MTAHVVYRALDPDLPATLSSHIVTGLLRDKLHYNGVVFGDDMDMKAISGHYGEEEAIALCSRSGIDVMLFCHELPRALRAFEFLYSEVERDLRLRTQVENSYWRITKLKKGFLKRFTGVDDRELENRLARSNHQRLVGEIQGSL
jgi:beta-N-acetylhexosaminidase